MSMLEPIRSVPDSPGPCCADDCCGGDRTAAAGAPTAESCDSPQQLVKDADVRGVVREKYGAVAQGTASNCGCCQGPADAEAVLGQLGYSAEQAAAIPEGANLGLGCGNPLAHAELAPGEVVLDLGSGGGIDCFLAAREVGPAGRAIGVDMTAAMLERARATAGRNGTANVEFRLGEIEHLPVADASIDVVISNCVVNLSPDKPQVFRESLRALRAGGRMVVSDLVLTRELGADLQRDVGLYVGCVAGAALEQDYLRMIREAGFERVEVLARHGYDVGIGALAEGSAQRDAFGVVVSVKVRAFKP